MAVVSGGVKQNASFIGALTNSRKRNKKWQVSKQSKSQIRSKRS